MATGNADCPHDIAPIGAFKSSMSGSARWSMVFNKDNCTREAKLADGSQVSLCVYAQREEEREEERVESHLRGTVLDSLAEQALESLPSGGLFDEWDTRSLNLSEARLNAVLSNLTISALSLGTWLDIVPVTVTRYESTYRFSHRRNLILSYAVFLACCLDFRN
ncbi:hypothetical protein BKA63DRAFT_563851 [Paraphoma chrysanthemicola]|nr:hypothetical protein BKA63DRAFT_563851 [Paraphoma chrysanthemicola]